MSHEHDSIGNSEDTSQEALMKTREQYEKAKNHTKNLARKAMSKSGKSAGALGKKVLVAGAKAAYIAIAKVIAILAAVISGSFGWLILSVIGIALVFSFIDIRGLLKMFDLTNVFSMNPTEYNEMKIQQAIALVDDQAFMEAYYNYLAVKSQTKYFDFDLADGVPGLYLNFGGQDGQSANDNAKDTQDFAGLMDYYRRENYFFLTGSFIKLADETFHQTSFHYPEQLIKPVYHNVDGSGKVKAQLLTKVVTDGYSGAWNGSNEEFIAFVGAMAQADMAESNVLASVTMAQAVLESGWGQSGLTAEANNLFGIKASSSWEGDIYEIETREWSEVFGWYTVTASFRKYDSWQDSIADHSALFTNNSRYAAVVGETDYVAATQAVKDGGYATDPDYVSKLVSLQESHNMTDYNSSGFTPPEVTPSNPTDDEDSAESDDEDGDGELFKIYDELLVYSYPYKEDGLTLEDEPVLGVWDYGLGPVISYVAGEKDQYLSFEYTGVSSHATISATGLWGEGSISSECYDLATIPIPSAKSMSSDEILESIKAAMEEQKEEVLSDDAVVEGIIKVIQQCIDAVHAFDEECALAEANGVEMPETPHVYWFVRALPNGIDTDTNNLSESELEYIMNLDEITVEVIIPSDSEILTLIDNNQKYGTADENKIHMEITPEDKLVATRTFNNEGLRRTFGNESNDTYPITIPIIASAATMSGNITYSYKDEEKRTGLEMGGMGEDSVATSMVQMNDSCPNCGYHSYATRKGDIVSTVPIPTETITSWGTSYLLEYSQYYKTYVPTTVGYDSNFKERVMATRGTDNDVYEKLVMLGLLVEDYRDSITVFGYNLGEIQIYMISEFDVVEAMAPLQQHTLVSNQKIQSLINNIRNLYDGSLLDMFIEVTTRSLDNMFNQFDAPIEDIEKIPYAYSLSEVEAERLVNQTIAYERGQTYADIASENGYTLQDSFIFLGKTPSIGGKTSISEYFVTPGVASVLPGFMSPTQGSYSVKSGFVSGESLGNNQNFVEIIVPIGTPVFSVGTGTLTNVFTTDFSWLGGENFTRGRYESDGKIYEITYGNIGNDFLLSTGDQVIMGDQIGNTKSESFKFSVAEIINGMPYYIDPFDLFYQNSDDGFGFLYGYNDSEDLIEALAIGLDEANNQTSGNRDRFHITGGLNEHFAWSDMWWSWGRGVQYLDSQFYPVGSIPNSFGSTSTILGYTYDYFKQGIDPKPHSWVIFQFDEDADDEDEEIAVINTTTGDSSENNSSTTTTSTSNTSEEYTREVINPASIRDFSPIRTPNADEIALANVMYGEAGGCSVTEIAGVAWVVFNRVDSGNYSSVYHAVTAAHQFHGYQTSFETNPSYLAYRENFIGFAQDLIDRWHLEKAGGSASEVGRVVPLEYLYFLGDGKYNHYTTTYIPLSEGIVNGKPTEAYLAQSWDWSLPSPYGETLIVTGGGYLDSKGVIGFVESVLDTTGDNVFDTIVISYTNTSTRKVELLHIQSDSLGRFYMTDDGNTTFPGGKSLAGKFIYINERYKNFQDFEAPPVVSGSDLDSGLMGDGVVSSSGWLWPLENIYNLSSLFGGRKHPISGVEGTHGGIDVPAGSGTPIMAAKGGTVSNSIYDSSYGNYIMVNHGNGESTLYAHMVRLSEYKVGDTVEQGQVIGYVGTTGSSTGNHLHYEYRNNGTRYDPVNLYPDLRLTIQGALIT